MSALEFRGVWKVYGRGTSLCTAIRGLDLKVEPGELVALLGASGSGKTTLLNLAAGLDRPTRGVVLLGGANLNAMKESDLAHYRRERVGFVFQSLNLLPALTASENIQLPLALIGMRRRERQRRAAALLDRAGLGDKAGAFPDEMSLGQQQRVAVLRALAHQPDFIFMDEPTASVDSRSAEAMMNLVWDLHQEKPVTILAATHDLRVAKRFSRVVRLLDGRIATGEGGVG